MIRYFAHHPTASTLLMSAIVFLGLMSATRLTRGLFPEFEVPIVKITTAYPGASADEVEQSVCRRIEAQIDGIDGIKRIESQAREGLGVTTVSLTDDVDPSEVRAEIDEQVGRLTDLPDLAEDMVVELLDIQLDVLFIAIGGDVAERDLLAYAEQMRDELLALEAVSNVTINGFSDHEVRIEVHEQALIAHGLSLRDVARAVREHSFDLPSGEISPGERDITVRVVDQRRWSEQFRDVTILSNTSGTLIPLRSLAEVHDSFDNDWIFATCNGRRACQLSIKTNSRDDVLSVAERVKAYLQESRVRYPDKIEFDVWRDHSLILQGRWRMVIENVALGVILVFLTLWVFLNRRLAFWVAMGIPISFLGTLWVLDVRGMPLDMISMLGLIVAIGLIVDDAIVIAENVFAHRESGESGVDAAVNGTKEVAVGVVSSMLTTIAIFAPLLMMKGTYSKITFVIPLCLIITLAVSLVEAFLILPKHLSHVLPDGVASGGGMRVKIDALIDYVRDDLYGTCLDWSLQNRTTTFAVLFALMIAAAGMVLGGRLAFRPMPEMESSWIAATVLMPEGTSSERTRQVAQQVEAALERVNQHFSPHETAGQDLVRLVCGFYGSLPQSADRGSHVAEIWLEMIDTEFRVASIEEVAAYWQQQVGDIADAQQLTFEQPAIGPQMKAIQIALQGRELDSLNRISETLQHRLRQIPGVKNIKTDSRTGKEEIRVQLKDAAKSLGVTSRDLANQLRAGFFGEHVQQFQRGEDVVDVNVMLHPDDRSSLQDVESFQVLTPSGDHVPLLEVAQTQVVRGYSVLSRLNGQPVVSVMADVNPAQANAASILGRLSRGFLPDLEQQHPGLTIQLRGEAEETGESIESMIRGAIIGGVAIFIVLSFTFRSYMEPMIVLLALPPGVIGALFGHWLLGMDISILSLIGLISLTGILVNDSIVMVEFIKLRLAEETDPHVAFARAGRDRFRAVVLTTATTCMGLLPMLLETSMQATIFQGLVISIMFGELFSTAMILLLIPCSYSLLNQYGLIDRSPREVTDRQATAPASLEWT